MKRLKPITLQVTTLNANTRAVIKMISKKPIEQLPKNMSIGSFVVNVKGKSILTFDWHDTTIDAYLDNDGYLRLNVVCGNGLVEEWKDSTNKLMNVSWFDVVQSPIMNLFYDIRQQEEEDPLIPMQFTDFKILVYPELTEDMLFTVRQFPDKELERFNNTHDYTI